MTLALMAVLCGCGSSDGQKTNEQRFPDKETSESALTAAGYTVTTGEKITVDGTDYIGTSLFAEKGNDFVFIFWHDAVISESEMYDWLCDTYPDAMKASAYENCAFAGSENGVSSARIVSVNFYPQNGAADEPTFTS